MTVLLSAFENQDFAIAINNMVPTESTALLGKRYVYYGNGYNGYHSNWYYYGRWIFAAVVIVAVIFIFFLWA